MPCTGQNRARTALEKSACRAAWCMLGSPLPHLHRDRARPCHIRTENGLAPPTSASRLASPLPHMHRDWACPSAFQRCCWIRFIRTRCCVEQHSVAASGDSQWDTPSEMPLSAACNAPPCPSRRRDRQAYEPAHSATGAAAVDRARNRCARSHGSALRRPRLLQRPQNETSHSGEAR